MVLLKNKFKIAIFNMHVDKSSRTTGKPADKKRRVGEASAPGTENNVMGGICIRQPQHILLTFISNIFYAKKQIEGSVSQLNT